MKITIIQVTVENGFILLERSNNGEINAYLSIEKKQQLHKYITFQQKPYTYCRLYNTNIKPFYKYCRMQWFLYSILCNKHFRAIFGLLDFLRD